jgi:hypothetical protein
VDILSLSVGPDEVPEDTLTFLSLFDIVMLFARRAGVFVVQAAGNHGPDPSTVLSYSPWTVGAAASGTDRSFPGSLLLGNGEKVGGVGLSGYFYFPKLINLALFFFFFFFKLKIFFEKSFIWLMKIIIVYVCVNYFLLFFYIFKQLIIRGLLMRPTCLNMSRSVQTFVNNVIDNCTRSQSHSSKPFIPTLFFFLCSSSLFLTTP